MSANPIFENLFSGKFFLSGWRNSKIFKNELFLSDCRNFCIELYMNDISLNKIKTVDFLKM